MTRTLTIWDASELPPSDGALCLWSGHADVNGGRSLLKYAEDNAERLRNKYLAWVYQVGERRVRGRRVIDILEIERGFSYWWMTGIVESNPYRFPISDIIRLFAIDEIVSASKIDRIALRSERTDLARVVESYCHAHGFAFAHIGVRPAEGPTPAPRLAALRTLLRQWRIARRFRGHAPKWYAGDDAVMICGYFVNVVASEAEAGRFQSRYWERLPAVLRELGRRVNWLHHNVGIDLGVARKWLSRFNGARDEQGYHVILNSFLTRAGIMRVLYRWWKLRRKARALGDPVALLRDDASRLSFWPLIESSWASWMSGATAFDNLLSIELFDRALKAAPPQRTGLYLYENNEWERAWIHAWRKHRHGTLIGVAHSTVRFWDLRYFHDPRTFEGGEPNPMPAPDKIAVNGRKAMKEYASLNYAGSEVVESEALRYEQLESMPAIRPAAVSGKRVLIIGDISPLYTAKMMALAEGAAKLQPAVQFVVKAHPVHPISANDFPNVQFKITDQPLRDALNGCDFAFASSTTSGAVDAWLAGVPCVVMLDESQLNLSPLRGEPGVTFVSTADELASALRNPGSTLQTRPEDFFFFDRQLARWRAIVSA